MENKKIWHNMEAEEVLKSQRVEDTKVGLSAAEVERRRIEAGLNKFAEKKKESLLVLILRQLKDVSVIVLLVAAGLSLALAIMHDGNFIERDFIAPIVIAAIVIMNTILAITQEKSAERALEALKLLNSPHCIVVRDGVVQEIDTSLLVPGDIIVLKTGALVPADARLFECEGFAVDESSLTGESEPSEKFTDFIENESIPLGDRKNMVFSGCLVVKGHAKAVVTSTGMGTEIGKIAGFLHSTKKSQTPLQGRLNKLGKMISTIAIIAAFAVLGIGLLLGEQDVFDLFFLAVALAVAAVPETLMLIVTLMLTNGVKKMVTKNALIRKLQAVETLGSTSVICSDKTGTLTQNRMSITRMWLYGSENPVSDKEIESCEHLWFLRQLMLASNAKAEQENGELKIIGDPTETAILRLSLEKGLDINSLG